MNHFLNTTTSADFMAFFRDEACLKSLTADERIEISLQILQGSSDITADLLNELLSDYSVHALNISQIK